MHLTCLFLDFFLPVLNDFNIAFQSGSSMIGHLLPQFNKLLRRLLGKFVQVKAITSGEDVTKVQYTDPGNHLDNNLIAIGLKTRTYISDNQDDLAPGMISNFFRNVRTFYAKVTEKMLKKFPFHEELLKKLAFLNPESRQNSTSKDIVELAQRFHPDMKMEEVEDEAADYILSPSDELPPFEDSNFEQFWKKMDNILTPDRQKTYMNLCTIAFTVPSIAHSNADAERSFSMLRKIQTDWRQNLGKDTIHSLLSAKIIIEEHCIDYNPQIVFWQRPKQ